jgi:hypothetical protein
MAKHDTLRWRMQALLDTDATVEPTRSWVQVAGGVGLNLAMVAWPAAQFELMMMFCERW